MKMFPDSKLPLKAEGFFERYLLYSFESRERWLVATAVSCLVMLGLWALTQWGIFGFFAGLNLIHLYLAFEARAMSRMIRRASGFQTKKIQNSWRDSAVESALDR